MPVSQADLASELTKFLEHVMRDSSVGDIPAYEERQTEAASPDKTNPNNYDPDVLKWFSELADLLEEKTDEWKILSKTLPIDSIVDFARQIQDIGKEISFSPLIDWGRNLDEQANGFQIDILPGTLKSFPVIIKNIRSLVKN